MVITFDLPLQQIVDFAQIKDKFTINSEGSPTPPTSGDVDEDFPTQLRLQVAGGGNFTAVAYDPDGPGTEKLRGENGTAVEFFEGEIEAAPILVTLLDDGVQTLTATFDRNLVLIDPVACVAQWTLTDNMAGNVPVNDVAISDMDPMALVVTHDAALNTIVQAAYIKPVDPAAAISGMEGNQAASFDNAVPFP